MREYRPGMSRYGGLVAMGAVMALLYGIYRAALWAWEWMTG